MRKLYLLLLSLIAFAAPLQAQVAADYAVQITASSQINPPQIKLQWRKLTGATSYTISRKAKAATAWSTIATLTGSDSTYTDASVAADSAYEYRIVKGAGIAATGYVYAGIQAPAEHTRGTMILLVDYTFRDSCAAEIAQLMADLRGDGWGLIRHDVGRSAAVTAVRGIVQADYNSHSNVSGLLLLGHIPVPYSGDLNPDGHTDHLGAWPTDAYYADVNGVWTDNSVNDTLASRMQNRNKPGDGKWDQTALPSALELQTGRIDFANMPAIGRTEVQLMRNYLSKAHSYKMDSLAIIRKGVVDDNFGAFSGEAFAANAWRLFPTIVGTGNIVSADFETILKDSAYQWGYGCGGGSYNSAGGIGSSVDFNTKAVKGIFTMLFGSYFGDWDAQNSFLRAPLCATEPALTCGWAGRPNWFFHHMALGESIGYSARLTQNNNIVYTPTNFGAGWIHTSLMGDPSLRTDYIKQPQGLTVTPLSNAGANLAWSPSPDAGVIGYYVYRCDSAWGTYARISGLLTATAFTDAQGMDGKKYYLLRPVKLQQTPSGSYYNLGVGIVDSATVSYPNAVAVQHGPRAVSVFPNPAKDRVHALISAVGNEAGTVMLLNVNGSILYSDKRVLHAGENTLTFDVSGWPAGMYILSLQTTEGMVMKKWVKTDEQ